jgi:hypothetical protein
MTTAAAQGQGRVTSRKEVIDILRGHAGAIRNLGATALYLFGSAARDEMRPDSDVDLFIDFDHESNFSFVEWIRIERLVAEALGRSVELASRDSLHPLLKTEIEQSSIRIF